MAVTVGGTSITFNDGTTQSTAAGAVTTTAVLNATAAASVGAVGTYGALVPTFGDFTYNPGATIAGSSLRYAGFYVQNQPQTNGVSTTAPAGTWRCMGYARGSSGCFPQYAGTLWLRIS